MFKAGTDCGEPTKKSVKRVTFSSVILKISFGSVSHRDPMCVAEALRPRWKYWVLVLGSKKWYCSCLVGKSVNLPDFS